MSLKGTLWTLINRPPAVVGGRADRLLIHFDQNVKDLPCEMSERIGVDLVRTQFQTGEVFRAPAWYCRGGNRLSEGRLFLFLESVSCSFATMSSWG